MDINNKYSGFEKSLKEKFDGFEYPYDNKEWMRLEKKLPESQGSFYSPKNLLRFVAVPAAVIISTAIILYMNKESDTNSKDKVTTVKTALNIQNNNEQPADEKIIANNEITNNPGNIEDTSSSLNNPEEPVTDKTDSRIDKPEIVKNDNPVKITVPDRTVSRQENIKTVAANNKKNSELSGELISADITEGCAPLKVKFKPKFKCDTALYLWTFGDGKKSAKKTVSHTYNSPGNYTITLTLKSMKSKASKKIVFSKNVIVKESPKAKFESVPDKESDVYKYLDKSDNAVNWHWSFGDKSTSNLQNPDHEYLTDGNYNVKLTVTNAGGCADTAYSNLKVANKRPFSINSGYNPLDPTNRYFGPYDLKLNPDGFKMCIYNETGKMVFSTTSPENKWNGKIVGTNIDAPLAVYIWIISMKNKNGIIQEWLGNVTLIR